MVFLYHKKTMRRLIISFLIIVSVGCYANLFEHDKKFIGSLLWINGNHADIAIKKAVRAVVENSNIVVAQVTWNKFEPHLIKDIEWYHNLALEHGKHFMINIDWLRQSRDATSGHWLFSDKSTEDMFKKTITEIVSRYSPDFLTLGIEVNYYALVNPEEYRQFIRIYNELKKDIKKISPKSKVGLSFQLELLLGNHKLWDENIVYEPLDVVVENLDYIGISTYPDVSNDNAKWSSHIYDLLKKYDKSIGILEIGIASDLYNQKARFDFINKAFEIYKTGELKFLIWGSIIDQIDDTASWRDSIGLLESSGEKKPDYSAWQREIQSFDRSKYSLTE